MIEDIPSPLSDFHIIGDERRERCSHTAELAERPPRDMRSHKLKVAEKPLSSSVNTFTVLPLRTTPLHGRSIALQSQLGARRVVGVDAAMACATAAPVQWGA